MWGWARLLAWFLFVIEETVRGNGHSEERMGDDVRHGQKKESGLTQCP